MSGAAPKDLPRPQLLGLVTVASPKVSRTVLSDPARPYVQGRESEERKRRHYAHHEATQRRRQVALEEPANQSAIISYPRDDDGGRPHIQIGGNDGGSSTPVPELNGIVPTPPPSYSEFFSSQDGSH
ncbi:hypothetical protein NLJ89_g4340 [Agrocybe chaxingu]|uniref:Uncharacterized protein n=1 Tax=Agrocybe chaxingu TaxID=84603 RepID=A0A9W8K315_9AGAR|nr:hypothetical protein NLJ89_g4340 [Agrocybe chaxingu]